MVSIWRPRFRRVSVNYILRWYCARLCARGPTLQRHIRPLLCRSCRNRVHATTKRHVALLTFACVPHARSGHMSEWQHSIDSRDGWIHVSSLREKRRNYSTNTRFPLTRICELVGIRFSCFYTRSHNAPGTEMHRSSKLIIREANLRSETSRFDRLDDRDTNL